MDSLVKFLGCGSIVKHNAKFSVEFVVTKFSDIQEKIIPFFEKNSLQGIKSLKFNSFTEAAELIKNKAHLNSEGLKKIKQIKERRNKLG